MKNVADLFSERDEYYEQLSKAHDQKDREKRYKEIEAIYSITQKESQDSLLEVASSS